MNRVLMKMTKIMVVDDEPDIVKKKREKWKKNQLK